MLTLLILACSTPPETPAPAPAVDPPERHAAVDAELAQGRRTVVPTDIASFPQDEQEMARQLVAVGPLIEELYLLQKGAAALRQQLERPADIELFERNAGPWCVAKATRDDPHCYALPGGTAPPRISGLYPSEVQTDGFCDTLAEQHPEVMDPFHVAVADGESVKAVPYAEHWKPQMSEVAKRLRAAADAAPPAEAKQAAYLRAAAKAFDDNSWFEADKAWADISPSDSAWYVRVGPDETYFDPCNRHAGFHLTLARVNPGGLQWQQRLDPLKQDLEAELARLAGPPYEARTVGFELPEFIDIVLNAGDARKPHGATVGQSLPNWGPTADAGGRTVAMVNLFQDPDSARSREQVASSLFCPTTMKTWTADAEPFLVTTVLHEAAHNLGPISSHKVDGKIDEELFGGPMASMLEELKAQTAALYFTDWLVARDAIEPGLAVRMHTADISWALGQVARGLYTPDGKSLAYPQLSAIQLGWLMDDGSVAWKAREKAANGTDTGCFEVTSEALPPAIDGLANEVLRIKGSGDKAAAEALKAKYVDVTGDREALFDVIAERYAREPQPSFVYEVD